MCKKIIALFLSLALVVIIAQIPAVNAVTSSHTAHSIAAGSSWDGNPLKGFVPFDGSTASFPYSMEWFYIPVSAVQTGMNTFDWTALDSHLNAISSRGHQAVFRFYLDYPAMPTGVPQFLINGGLTMNSYSEYGGGLCPNYSDQNLRTAIKNFIAALGARYDGNSKVGFITAGLLGFWGEWHCYPYDSDTSDGKPNWEPSDIVKNEILTAFDNAFNKTPLLLRYPAANAPNMNFGYHDDSFVWETLNTNSWNFVPRLVAAGVQNKWQQQPIGGELRPEIQDTIFENSTWTGGNGEKWTDCVNATHVTWLMNEAIKRYSYGSTEYNNAITAAKQMGYDFRIEKAYYDNLSGSSSSLYVGIDIKNIGTAPFYYDSSTWPIKIGVKQNGTLITSWTTPWNLNTIAADGIARTLEFTTPNGCGLNSGTYNLCIMVQSPLSNGNKLGFANAGQNSDGWLDLGTFTVGAQTPTQPEQPSSSIIIDGSSSDWSNIGTIATATYSSSQRPTAMKVTSDANYIYLSANGSNLGTNNEWFINSDNNSATGYTGNVWGSFSGAIGADYMVELGVLYAYTSTGDAWTWTSLGNSSVSESTNSTFAEVRVARSALTSLGNTIGVGYRNLDASWNCFGSLPAASTLATYNLGSGGGSTPITPISYEAESSTSTLTGGATVSSGSNCSGGSKVGYIGNNNGTLQFNNVSANSTGTYNLSIYYLSGENRSVYMSVNGGTGVLVEFSSLGDWTTVGSKTVTVNLNSGNNTIKFYNNSAWAPDIDRIVVN